MHGGIEPRSRDWTVQAITRHRCLGACLLVSKDLSWEVLIFRMLLDVADTPLSASNTKIAKPSISMPSGTSSTGKRPRSASSNIIGSLLRSRVGDWKGGGEYGENPVTCYKSVRISLTSTSKCNRSVGNFLGIDQVPRKQIKLSILRMFPQCLLRMFLRYLRSIQS